MRVLRGRLSGLCLPAYVLDMPGGLARCQLARHTPAVNQQPGQVGNKSRALADRGQRRSALQLDPRSGKR